MAQRHKTRYQNVIYIETTTNGKPDKVYYIRFRENGKSKEIKIGKYSEGIRENYCNQKLLATNNAIRLGEQPPIVANSHKKEIITFNQIAIKYFDARELYNRTNHQARSKYNSQLRPYIGNKDINLITKNDILKIQTELAKTRAPKTVNQYIQFIRAVYNFAIDEEIYLGTNPTKGIKEQKVDNKRERFLTVTEVKDLLEAVKDDANLYLFTLLSLTTGGRLNTIMEIAKKDVDLTHGMITLKDIKNDDTYGGFFDARLKGILEEKMKFLNPNDKIVSMNSRTLRRRMSTILTKLFNENLESNDRKNRAVVHTLRHTFASQLAIGGAPIFTIQNLLNHRDIKQTLRYAKLSPESGRDMVNSIMKKF
jgi:site-specific recombinase XerD